MKKIFITGESGTIPLQIQIIANNFGFEIVNTQLKYNFLTPLKKHQSFKVRKPEIDFLDIECLEKMPWKEIDLVIHSGAFVGTDFCASDPNLSIKTNVEGTQNIVNFCNRNSIPLIYLSTTAILDPKDYGLFKPINEKTKINPQTLYGITKYSGELIVKNLCSSKYLILRPVFGFGSYPDDLHSALTKIIYIMYKNLVEKTENNLVVLLDKLINKSYTRVENIASCILSLAKKYFFEDFKFYNDIINIGENFSKSKNWFQIFEIIAYSFAIKGICTTFEFYNSIEKWVRFLPAKDYLHYHNMDDSKLLNFNLNFEKLLNYIPLDEGINLTVDSVIENSKIQPYWL